MTRIKKILTHLLIATVLMVALLVPLIPVAIQPLVSKLCEGQQLQCELGGLTINWLAADVVLDDVKFEDKRNGIVVALDKADLRLNWSNIFALNYVADSIVLESLLLELKPQENKPNSPDTQDEEPKVNPLEQLSSLLKLMPKFQITDFQLKRSLVKADVGNQSHQLHIEMLGFKNMVVQPQMLSFEHYASLTYNDLRTVYHLESQFDGMKQNLNVSLDSFYTDIDVDAFRDFVPEELRMLKGTINANTQVELSTENGLKVSEAKIELIDVKVAQQKAEMQLDSLLLHNIQVSAKVSQELVFSDFTLNGSTLIQGVNLNLEKHNIKGKALQIDGIYAELLNEQSNINIDNVVLQSWFSHLELPKGQNNSQQIKTDASTQDKEASNPVRININQLSSLGSLQFEIVDPSLKKTVTHHFTIDELTSKNLNNQSLPLELKFDTAFEDGNQINTQVVQNQLGVVTVQTDISRLSLPMFSPYVEQALGSAIYAGNFDGKVNVVIQNGTTKGRLEGNLIGIDLATNAESGGSAIGTFSMNTLLNQLKDAGQIELDIPFQFTEQDSTVSLTGFLTLIGKRLANQLAKQYVADTLLPYSSVVKLVITNSSELFKVRFEPLLFEAEQWQVNESQQANLRVLASYLVKNDDVQISVCPFVSQSESELSVTVDGAKGKQIMPLAEARVWSVKQNLAASSIGNNRLISCKGSRTSLNGKPRVEFNAL
jgi:hypothetical protein